MSVEGTTREGWKLQILRAVGPSADVAVSPGTATDIDLSLEEGPAVKREILGFKSLTGLPDGLVVAGISYPDLGTVRVRVFNPTAGTITATSLSVTALAIVKGY